MKINTFKDNFISNSIGFAVGAILMLNITGAYAQPTTPPRNGNVHPVFSSFSVSDSLNISGNFSDTLGDGYIDFDDHVRLKDGFNLVMNNNSYITNEGLSGTGTPRPVEIEDEDGILLDGDVRLLGSSNLDISGASYLQDLSTDGTVDFVGDLQISGNLYTSAGYDIGSYQRRYTTTGVAGMKATPAKDTAAVACRTGTYIVSCQSWTSEATGTSAPLRPTENYGTQINRSANTCRGFFKETHSGSATQYIEAICFDPTGTYSGNSRSIIALP